MIVTGLFCGKSDISKQSDIHRQAQARYSFWCRVRITAPVFGLKIMAANAH